MGFNDSDELEYLGSDLGRGAKRDVKPEDEGDLPALKAIQALFDEQIALYTSIDKLQLGNTVFSIEQQIAINAEVKARLLEHKATVDEIIQDIKDKYEQ